MIRRRGGGVHPDDDYDDDDVECKTDRNDKGHHHHHHHQGVNYNILPNWLVIVLAALIIIIGWNSSSTSKSNNNRASNNNSKRKSESFRWLLTPEEDEALEYDSNGVRYHTVFSTDCSDYQHWQSYLVFYSAMRVRQPGHVTRIVSGCNETQAIAMLEWFQTQISIPMSQHRFHLQFTPGFSAIKNDQGQVIGDYKFFNKPFGFLYWLEHDERLQYHAKPTTKKDGNGAIGTFPDAVSTDIVTLIDPDMGFVQPLTADLSNALISPNRQKEEHLITRHVMPGKPAAQVYGFGAQWQKLDLERIAGKGTPAASVSQWEGRLYYPVGPPYMGTVTDMHAIATAWSQFVPATYQQYPHLLAEMFAFSIAAAHLKLPFQLIDSFMISDVTIDNGEGWALIDALPTDSVCPIAKTVYNDHDNNNQKKYQLPNVVHYCQRYCMGQDWFFTKRRIPADFLSCQAPLFQEPPADSIVQYDFRLPPPPSNQNAKIVVSKKEAARQSFMLCYLYQLMNDAAVFYKNQQQHLDNNNNNIQDDKQQQQCNMDKSRNLVQYITQQEQEKSKMKVKS